MVVVTDGLGGYRFADLEPGQYVVSFPLPQGQQRSPKAAAGDDTIDSDADPRTGLSSVITVDAGANVSTVDSGLFAPPSVLGGLVWTDKEGNGRLDQGESAIADVKLELLDAAGQLAATTTSGPSGTYQFVGLAPGRYQLRLDPATLPGGVAFTTRDVGLTADIGSDVDEGMGTTVFIDVGRAYSNTSWDIGLTFVGTVADGVWLDDGNGIKDPGEPLVSGVTVALLDSAGTTVNATVTDDAGNYRFAACGRGRTRWPSRASPPVRNSRRLKPPPTPTSTAILTRRRGARIRSTCTEATKAASMAPVLCARPPTSPGWHGSTRTTTACSTIKRTPVSALTCGCSRVMAGSSRRASSAGRELHVPGRRARHISDRLHAARRPARNARRWQGIKSRSGDTPHRTLRPQGRGHRRFVDVARRTQAIGRRRGRGGTAERPTPVRAANRAGRVVLAASSAALAMLALLRGWRQRQRRRALR